MEEDTASSPHHRKKTKGAWSIHQCRYILFSSLYWDDVPASILSALQVLAHWLPQTIHFADVNTEALELELELELETEQCDSKVLPRFILMGDSDTDNVPLEALLLHFWDMSITYNTFTPSWFTGLEIADILYKQDRRFKLCGTSPYINMHKNT